MNLIASNGRIFLAISIVLALLAPAHAQILTGMPKNSKGVKVEEKLGLSIPLDLTFQDDTGATKKLSDVISGKRPVLLTLNYSGCPGLCVAQLDGLVRVVEQLQDVELGKDFELISISIDPRETAEKAHATKERYTKGLSAPHDRNAWHFWTGSPKSIAKIADEVGFRYTYDKENDRYNHIAMAVAISPKGKITRYLYDVGFEPNTMKMALVEASEGTVGTPFDSFVLWCMHYDSRDNRYTADAKKLLSVTAGIFAFVVLVTIAPFWLTSKKNIKEATQVESTEPPPTDTV